MGSLVKGTWHQASGPQRGGPRIPKRISQIVPFTGGASVPPAHAAAASTLQASSQRVASGAGHSARTELGPTIQRRAAIAAPDQPEQNMSTPQSIPHVTPRVRIGLGTTLTALGVLLAIAVTITILALTGANSNQTTVATPVTASQAASGSTPQTRYLGPRQHQAATDQQSGTTITAGAGRRAGHYACLGAAQRCLR